MDKTLFIFIFNNSILRKEIFKKVRYINRDILKYNSYKWNVIKNKPSYLAAYDYFDLLKERYKKMTSKMTWYERIVGSADLDSFISSVLLVLIKYGHLHTVKYFIKKQKSFNDFMVHYLVKAVCHGRFEIVKYLVSLTKPTFTHTFMLGYAPLGLNFDLLVWLVENKLARLIANGSINKYIYISMRNATVVGRLDMLQYLVNNTKTRLDTKDHLFLENAVSSGNVKMVKWLLEQGFSFRESEYYIDTAAAKSHLDLVKYLHQHKYGRSRGHLLDIAARSDNLELLQWIHENRTNEITTCDAIDKAAANADLHVVQWLYENRSEGCSTLAIDKASSVSLTVVKWLFENQSAKCTPRAMENALAARHADIMEWLFINIPEKCNRQLFTTGTLSKLIEENIENNETLIFLLEHRHQLITTEVNLKQLLEYSKFYNNSIAIIKSFK
ncbi:hypothetical protein PPL_11074 [Heterostelium album PN500]|uniref:Ankyrin repeat protein n=1 Tax=Heterostelium pallidum (strain ATCC 26659 / Pp 5 / PN500) TaxID=670386 RepID=D3BSV4_HETP5|nr:hypothetical protein PPL_11074 [Heterostelium album PN500]EFA75569.1 hypothetical protein PPL_11074 [Heterostelium album PN500]|eukprot:XP_020427703.1 hypothetical protein PPL_11074 [Heterostelium album PN500]